MVHGPVKGLHTPDTHIRQTKFKSEQHVREVEGVVGQRCYAVHDYYSKVCQGRQAFSEDIITE